MYEHVFATEGGNPDLPFEQVYDLATVQPLRLWDEMYQHLKTELQDMGLAL